MSSECIFPKRTMCKQIETFCSDVSRNSVASSVKNIVISLLKIKTYIYIIFTFIFGIAFSVAVSG